MNVLGICAHCHNEIYEGQEHVALPEGSKHLCYIVDDLWQATMKTNMSNEPIGNNTTTLDYLFIQYPWLKSYIEGLGAQIIQLKAKVKEADERVLESVTSEMTADNEMFEMVGVVKAGAALIDFIKAKADFTGPWRCPYMAALDAAVTDYRALKRMGRK